MPAPSKRRGASSRRVRRAGHRRRTPPHAAARILDAPGSPAGARAQAGGAPPPAYRYLVHALEHARAAPEAGAPAEAFAALEPELGWIRRAGSAAYGPVFHDGHANAIIVGPEGLERRGDVPIGVSLVAPNVRYVDHRHPPGEVHLVMK